MLVLSYDSPDVSIESFSDQPDKICINFQIIDDIWSFQ